MDAFMKILPLIIVALAIFAAKEGFSIFKYVRYCKLHEAAKTGRLDEVQALLDEGHNPGAIDPRFGLTPLHYAVRNGHVQVAKLLMQHGASLDAPSSQGITARQWASEHLAPEAQKVLEDLAVELRNEPPPLSQETDP